MVLQTVLYCTGEPMCDLMSRVLPVPQMDLMLFVVLRINNCKLISVCNLQRRWGRLLYICTTIDHNVYKFSVMYSINSEI